jgi:hypothetical protein
MKSPFIWALAILCGLAVDGSSQVTAPLGSQFAYKKFRYWNEAGRLLVSATLEKGKIDTLPEIRLRAVIRDTLTDPRRVIFEVASSVNNRTAHETDTVLPQAQLWLPQKTRAKAGLPDSTFSLVLSASSSLKAGESFRLALGPAAQDEGLAHKMFFARDTVKGLSVDTSEAMDISRSAGQAVFGFRPGGSLAACYMVLYNAGFGWGLSVPGDTLADSSWTAAAQTGELRYREAGPLLDAEQIKIIRRGLRGADTARVEEFLRISPR